MDDMQTIDDFIKENFKSKADFARQLGVFPQQIQTWKAKGYLVHKGVMYRPMRTLCEFE